ncbi:MAG TPA: alpha/beta hydrolase [Steroidobacteraceae bacterium]|nr:alpha/beta hydrolase [Steroidobacteraceae bacterium]HQR49175.1 alpha/beta hydrolase [Steroidobacteraceae bacterium]
MPSLRARLTNAFLRVTTKSMWKPGLDIHKIRVHSAKMDARIARKPLPIATEPAEVAGVKATWYGDRSLEANGTILYLHGGAWCLHLPAIFSRHAARLSQLTGMRILLPDYRLAPEHPFPAGVDDCYTAYRWLVEHGYAQRPLAVAGDSAGGSLTLTTLMQARDAGLPLPNCAVMLSPSTDLLPSAPSWTYNSAADPMFGPGAVDLLPKIYCPGMDRTNPLLSPLFGKWHGLPPLLFHAGSTEMILDDSVRAHDRARQAGVAAEIEVWIEMPHVFQVFSWLPESKLAMRRIADFIVAHARRSAAGVGANVGGRLVDGAVRVAQQAPVQLEIVPPARIDA